MKEMNGTTNTNSPPETNKTNSFKETKETDRENIKDEWNGRAIYFPGSILDDLKDMHRGSQLKFRKADRDESRKAGFSTRSLCGSASTPSDADADEIQTRLSAIDDVLFSRELTN